MLVAGWRSIAQRRGIGYGELNTLEEALVFAQDLENRGQSGCCD